jgi:hypothetical protein
VTTIVEVICPFAVTDVAGVTLTDDCEADAAPTLKVTEVDVALTLAEASVAVIVKGPLAIRPDKVGLVNVATPVALVDAEVNESVADPFTLNVMVVPEVSTGLPWASSTVTATVPSDVPLATDDAGS